MAVGEMEPAKPLLLTRQEAYSLLSLVVASTAAVAEAEEDLLRKLGDLLRAFLREEAAPERTAREGRGREPRRSQVVSAVSVRTKMQRTSLRRLPVRRAGRTPILGEQQRPWRPPAREHSLTDAKRNRSETSRGALHRALT